MKRSQSMTNEAKPILTPKLRFPEFRGKSGWKEIAIGQISDTVTAGGTPDTSESTYWDGNIRWMNSGELNLKRVYEVDGRITEKGLRNSSTKVIPLRCVLIGLAGQGKTRGTIAMNMVELCVNQSIAAIFPNESVFESDFLYQNLGNRYNELRSLSAGGEGRGGLNLQIIKSLQIPLPSLAEQQKIAECLSSLDELIGAEGQKLHALKAHKKGLTQQLFPREGETLPRLRFPEFRDAGEWVEKPLGQLLVSSPDYGVNAAAVPFSEVLPKYLRITDISEDGTYLSDKMVSVDIEATDGNYLDEGDIALARTGASVGKSYRYRKEDGPLVFAGFLIRLKPSKKKLVSAYLANFLMTDLYWDWVAITSTRSGQPGINSTEYSSLSIPLPPGDLSEQHRIASCLSSLDDLIAAQSNKLEALKTQKKGLMQQLFPSPGEEEA